MQYAKFTRHRWTGAPLGKCGQQEDSEPQKTLAKNLDCALFALILSLADFCFNMDILALQFLQTTDKILAHSEQNGA